MCVPAGNKKTWESLRRTFAKAISYRIIHYLLHLSEAYLVIWFYPRYGHIGPVLIVALMQVLCTIHYVAHERIFARLKWGYKIKEVEINNRAPEDSNKKTKLYTIRFFFEDEVKGNRILMNSGSVQHIGPQHTWLVSEEQICLLKKKGIRYAEVILRK